MEKVIEGIYTIYPGMFCSNSYLILGEKITLIDTGTKSNIKNLRAALRQLCLSPEKVDLILHTHCHADHISADNFFLNANVYASKIDGQKMNEKDSAYCEFSHFKEEDVEFPKKTVKFFENNSIIDLGKFKLQVIPTPFHTKGMVCFFDAENKILFSGDALFEGTFGRTDLVGSIPSKTISSLKKLQELDFEVLCAGHGKVFKGNQKKNLEKVLNMVSLQY